MNLDGEAPGSPNDAERHIPAKANKSKKAHTVVVSLIPCMSLYLIPWESPPPGSEGLEFLL